MQNPQQLKLQRKSLFLRGAGLILPLVCAVVLLAQTVFAQNTYVITDGDRVVVHTTYATDPQAVLSEAGLTLDEDDTYTTQAGLGVSEITVRRGQRIRIEQGGEVTEASSYGETVESLLSRMNVPLDPGTKVSHDLGSDTYDGMTITVTANFRAEETYTQDIPFETLEYADPTLPEGTRVVLTEGRRGQAVCTASVLYADGAEISRTILSQTVTSQPVNQVVAVGTQVPGKTGDVSTEAQPVIGDGVIITPTGEVLTYTKEMTMLATAYSCEGHVGITATGTVARVGAIAVDPKVIPYGTRMFIVSSDGQYIYGIATAEDCGGLIKGKRIDLYYDTIEECVQFGARNCQVYILG